MAHSSGSEVRLSTCLLSRAGNRTGTALRKSMLIKVSPRASGRFILQRTALGSFWKRAGSHALFEPLLPFKSNRFPPTCPVSILQDHNWVLSEPQSLAVLKRQGRGDKSSVTSRLLKARMRFLRACIHAHRCVLAGRLPLHERFI